MSDELNVWHSACDDAMGSACGAPDCEDCAKAAAVIRTYGDERYQAAIADVVEWLREERYGRFIFEKGETLILSNEITRRFGKGQ